MASERAKDEVYVDVIPEDAPQKRVKDAENGLIYLCGWCGFPCDEEGRSLPLDYDEAMAYLRDHGDAEVKQVDGTCCSGEMATVDERDPLIVVGDYLETIKTHLTADDEFLRHQVESAFDALQRERERREPSGELLMKTNAVVVRSGKPPKKALVIPYEQRVDVPEDFDTEIAVEVRRIHRGGGDE